MLLAITQNQAFARRLCLRSKPQQHREQMLVNGQLEKPSLWPRDTKQQVEVIVTEKKKTSNARFSTEPQTLGGTDSQGSTDDDFGVRTGDSYIYRTKNGKTNTMGFTMPDAKAKEYASELQRETRGMKKGGVVSASKRADGCCIKGKTKGRIV
jgi:hypothetical protein